MKPHERRQEQTRNDLIDQAITMIVERGIDGLSIRALADNLDYTPGALYTYFPGKDELIDAARERCFVELNSFVSQRMESLSSTPEMLLEAGLAYIDFARAHPNKYHLMFGLEPSRSTSVEQRSSAMSSLEGLLRRGLDTGELVLPEGYDLGTAAMQCWTTVHGIASLLPTVLAEEHEETVRMARIILKNGTAFFTAGSQEENR
jgi:AcrR family transcriptional regulator